MVAMDLSYKSYGIDTKELVEEVDSDAPSQTFFVSDLHLGHGNIIKYVGRPFKNVYDMDNALISGWNSVVRENDEVYFLGDFTLGGHEMADHYFSKLNGSRIWVLSNPWHHDKRWLNYRANVIMNDVHPQYRTRTGGWIYLLPPIHVLELREYQKDGHSKAVVLCHYDMAVWDRKHYFSWLLFGHSHSTGFEDELKLDVGVDNAKFLLGEYRPFRLSEIAEIMLKKEASHN